MVDFLEFTRADGTKMMVGRAWIQAVMPPISGEYTPSVNTLLVLSGETVGITERYDDIRFVLGILG